MSSKRSSKIILQLQIDSTTETAVWWGWRLFLSHLVMTSKRGCSFLGFKVWPLIMAPRLCSVLAWWPKSLFNSLIDQRSKMEKLWFWRYVTLFRPSAKVLVFWQRVKNRANSFSKDHSTITLNFQATTNRLKTETGTGETKTSPTPLPAWRTCQAT